MNIDALQKRYQVLHKKLGRTRSTGKQNSLMRRMKQVSDKIKEIKDGQERNSARRNRA